MTLGSKGAQWRRVRPYSLSKSTINVLGLSHVAPFRPDKYSRYLFKAYKKKRWLCCTDCDSTHMGLKSPRLSLALLLEGNGIFTVLFLNTSLYKEDKAKWTFEITELTETEFPHSRGVASFPHFLMIFVWNCWMREQSQNNANTYASKAGPGLGRGPTDKGNC